MKKHLSLVLGLTSGFKQVHFEKVPCSQNTCANTLSKLNGGEPTGEPGWNP